jgi:hypothetical protein
MNAAKFRVAIKLAASYAAQQKTTDIDARARAFVAALSGCIENDEPALSAIVWEAIRPSVVVPAEPLTVEAS